jgi:hypothetical protein
MSKEFKVGDKVVYTNPDCPDSGVVTRIEGDKVWAKWSSGYDAWVNIKNQYLEHAFKTDFETMFKEYVIFMNGKVVFTPDTADSHIEIIKEWYNKCHFESEELKAAKELLENSGYVVSKEKLK